MRLAVVVLLCTAACGSAPLNLGFGVAVTATFDSNVSDSTLETVTQIVISASGDETYMDDDQLMRAPHRTEELVYRPEASTRRIALTLTAEDANHAPIAVGQSAMVQLDADKTAQIEITLFAAVPPDAGAPDAQPMDASLTDASDDGPPLKDQDAGAFHVCTGLSYELCEDFEHTLGSEWTTMEQVNATLVTGTAYAHSGGHAMHVHLDALAPNGTANGFLQETTTFALPNTDFHARAFFYFPTPPPDGTLQMIEAQQAVTPFLAMDFQLVSGHYAMYDHFGVTTKSVEDVSAALGPGSWRCIEWAVHFGAPGLLVMSVDGIPLTSTEINDTTTSTPPMGELFFGAAYTNTSLATSLAVDFWMDDLVVDPNLIGCSE